MTHYKYTIYNPVHHPFSDQEGGRLIYFEGTVSNTFSGSQAEIPAYDYNQMMYRLALDDPRLVLPVCGVPTEGRTVSAPGGGRGRQGVGGHRGDPLLCTRAGATRRHRTGSGRVRCAASRNPPPTTGLTATGPATRATGRRSAGDCCAALVVRPDCAVCRLKAKVPVCPLARVVTRKKSRRKGCLTETFRPDGVETRRKSPNRRLDTNLHISQ